MDKSNDSKPNTGRPGDAEPGDARQHGRKQVDVPAEAGGRPTLKTIAFMTGLGVTTVSRALKDAPEIGEEKVHRALDDRAQVAIRDRVNAACSESRSATRQYLKSDGKPCPR